MNYQAKRLKIEAKLEKLKKELKTLEEKRKLEIADLVFKFNLDKLSNDKLADIFASIQSSMR